MSWIILLLGSLSLIGCGLIAVIAFNWSRSGSFLSELWPKTVLETVQIASAFCAVRAGFEKEKGDDWYRLLISATACLGIWKFVQMLVDYRIKIQDKNSRKRVEALESESGQRLDLLATLRQLVDWKTARILDAVVNRGEKSSLVSIRNALTPKPHFEDLLVALIEAIASRMPEGSNTTRNIRVALYLERDGAMVPCGSANKNNATSDPFSSYRRHRDHFRTDREQKPSHAVLCVQRQGTIITEDCGAAVDAGTFHYFNEQQPNYLKSLLAHYMGAVCDDDGMMVRAALLIDTDLPNFFRVADIENWKLFLREFVSRIKLERALLALLQAKGKNRETRNGST